MTNLKHLRFEIVVSIDLGDYLVCSEVTLAKSGSSFYRPNMWPQLESYWWIGRGTTFSNPKHVEVT